MIGETLEKEPEIQKLLNKSNLKMSFATGPNIAQKIIAKNSKIINPQWSMRTGRLGDRYCNCPIDKICPLQGACLSKDIVYREEVTKEIPPNKKGPERDRYEIKRHYYGLTSINKHLRNH